MMTAADFLDWPGDGTGTRYELVDGVLRAMAPASVSHSVIQANLAAALVSHFRATGRPCIAAINPGIQPRLRAEWNFRIPDLAVSCSSSRPGDVMLPDPLVIVEVLSPGNAQDTYENVRASATLPSVQEIVVIHSTRMRVELLERGAEGDWPSDPDTIDAGGTLALASIAADLPLAEIYAGTYLTSTANPTT